MITTCRSITVASRKHDPRTHHIQKYDNGEPWNAPGGITPTGVSATRYLRTTVPDRARLSPLAAWLATHVPGYVAGRLSHPQPTAQVLCTNGKTRAEMLPSDATRRAYRDLDGDALHQIDWLFSIIEPEQTDHAYWNTEAEKMLMAGIVEITVGSARWTSAPLETHMKHTTFQRLMRIARLDQCDWSVGYQRGLRRHYHGERFGTIEEHERWMSLGLHGDHRLELGDGYRAGFAGQEIPGFLTIAI